LEQLGTRVKDFVDTTRLYAQVQDAISEALNEDTSSETGRSRAWDYFHDGFKVDHKVKRRESESISEIDAPFEFQVEPQVVHQDTLQAIFEDSEKVNNKFGLKLETNSTAELDCIIPSPRYADIINAKEIQSSYEKFSFVPETLKSKSNETSPVISSVNYEEETIAASTDENTVIDTTDTDAADELDQAFRFTTVCDLRDEVLGPPPSAPFQLQREKLRQEQAFKRKVSFKKFAIKKMIDRESAERSRRRKYRMAIFDANRAHSVTAVLGELDSVVELDTPTERLFRLEHPEYFPKEPSESREERLREYEEARSSYDAKTRLKRLRELDDDQENKKVARQKVQEEKNRNPPSESEIWESRKEKDSFPSDKEDYDDDESDEEFDAFEESSVPLQVRQHTRRKKTFLSYNELRRQVKEKERSEKAQRELTKIQETARKCQIEDLRHQILEEERNRKRQKLVDLSNERDRRDAITIQHIREVAATKIAIGRAIRELEDKISAAEAQFHEKKS
ncbi:10304_t:CDS:2, partial [Funneliformis geosporum]